MQFIDRDEKKMKPEEKLKLEIMRTIISGKGFNLRDEKLDFNFTERSNTARIASFLMKRFDMSYKDKSEGTAFWPEKDLSWPGKAEAEAERASEKKEESDVSVNPEEPDVTGKPEEEEVPAPDRKNPKEGKPKNKKE